jgi:hypothetical protein
MVRARRGLAGRSSKAKLAEACSIEVHLSVKVERTYSKMSPSRGVQALLSLVLFLSVQVLALQANLAGVVDWHKPLIGTPLLDPSPPSFIDTPQGKRVVAITRSNVLVCLSAESGEIGVSA